MTWWRATINQSVELKKISHWLFFLEFTGSYWLSVSYFLIDRSFLWSLQRKDLMKKTGKYSIILIFATFALKIKRWIDYENRFWWIFYRSTDGVIDKWFWLWFSEYLSSRSVCPCRVAVGLFTTVSLLMPSDVRDVSVVTRWTSQNEIRRKWSVRPRAKNTKPSKMLTSLSFPPYISKCSRAGKGRGIVETLLIGQRVHPEWRRQETRRADTSTLKKVTKPNLHRPSVLREQRRVSVTHSDTLQETFE